MCARFTQTTWSYDWRAFYDIPMDGYCEWRTEDGAKQPYLVAGAEPLAVAGLWETWTDPAPGELLETCTVITTESAPDLRALRDRTPVMLADGTRRQAWLDPATLTEVLGQLILPLSGLHYRAVSKRVNKVGNDGPDLLDPIAAGT